MIQLSRQRDDDSGQPIRPPQSWFDAAASATQSALDENEDHEADAAVYAHDHVRPALEELFFFKCVYCEKPLDEEWDVEHYRPKGSVAERDAHPGYYWLAYDWLNLFPSCKHCNQRRKDKPIWGDLSAGPSAGKKDQFPVADESKRAMTPNDSLTAESPLLLHPVDDNPEPLMGFDPLGDVFAVDNNVRAKATISICHLRRRRLRRPRREVIGKVVALLTLIRDAQANAATPNTLPAGLQELLQTTFLEPECAFAGTARYVMDHAADFGV